MAASSQPESTYHVLRESVHRYPVVKFAFGVAAIMAAVAVAYSLSAGLRVTMVVLAVLAVIVLVMVVLAKINLHAPSDFELPSRVMVEASLVLFTIASVALFFTLIFGFPFTIGDLRSWATFSFPRDDTQRPVLIPDTDSGWITDHMDVNQNCAKKSAAYGSRYPSYTIEVASATVKDSVGDPKLYNYRCSFKAIPK